MASLVVSGDTSGAITIAAPAIAGTNTLTLPASTGTLVATGGAQTIEFAAGTVSAPSITTTGDTNTGIFFPAADTIAFTEGGVEAARFDASGRLLINTTTARTTITGDRSALVQLEAQSVDQFLSIFRNENNAFGSTLWLGKSRGTTAGSNTTVQSGDSLASITFLGANGTDTQQGAAISVQATGTISASAMPANMLFSTSGAGSNSPSERMRITSGGDLLVGTTSTSIVSGWTAKGIAMSGDLTGGAMTINSSSSTGTQYFIGFGRGGSLCGSIQSTGTNATSYSTSSDYRLKENIAPMVGALNLVQKLKPVTYDWISTKEKGQGFIAHELQEVIPDAVTGEKDAVDADGNIKPQGVDTSFLVATLTAAIQEQQQIINDLKARIETLENT